MLNSISTVRTEPAIVYKSIWQGFFTDRKYELIVVGPHYKNGDSHLTMGVFQNYAHSEYSISIVNGLPYIRRSVCYNDYTHSGGMQAPYTPDPEKCWITDAPETAKLIYDLYLIESGQKPRPEREQINTI